MRYGISTIKSGITLVAVGCIALAMSSTYAKDTDLDTHDADIKAAISQHDSTVKADIATHEGNMTTDHNNLSTEHNNLSTAVTQHDSDVKNDIATHDGNMTLEHNALSTDHGHLSAAITQHDSDVNTKLDEILNSSTGECPDCCDAWSKVIDDANDRFELVMGGEAVLDKETCLVWEKSPSTTIRTCYFALSHCFLKKVGGRKGWRTPTIEELATLVDDTQNNPSLPAGHPFQNVMSERYWSSTTSASTTSTAWNVLFSDGSVNGSLSKDDSNFYVWCVRGGQGYDAY